MQGSCLFISYDGLLDSLGQSQILPYIRGIAKHPRQVFILSFEKKEKYQLQGLQLKEELYAEGIFWQPMRFSQGFSYLSKSWDLVQMLVMVGYFLARYPIKVIHARGHICAMVGDFWKNLFFVKVLFDFRGLWVDERIDKGGWNLEHYFDRLLYRICKKQEKKLLRKADHVVVLTEAVKPELMQMGLSHLEKVSVIPCCADFQHFRVLSKDEKKIEREKYHIPLDAWVLGYSGSIGKVYMMDKFFEFVEQACLTHLHTFVLIITPDESQAKKIMHQYLKDEFHSRVIVRSASRMEMPRYLSVMDLMISFIKPSYARLATSPTKIAESLACGIPVISNDGIGDVTTILKDLGIGAIGDDFLALKSKLENLRQMDGETIRARAEKIFNLNQAHFSYAEAYKRLERMEGC